MYLFIYYTEGKGGRERGGETSMVYTLTGVRVKGPNPQRRPVP